MEREEATTSSGLYGGRGAGGKFRKPLARKAPTTPYDRPPAVNHSRRDGGGGWLSRFANRILPSFISNSFPYWDPPTVSEDQDLPLKQATSIDGQENTYSLEVTTSPGVEGPNKPVDRSSYDSGLDDHEEDTTRSLGGDNKLCEIEKMLKEKKFSSEEISRLTKILDSKIVDSSMDVNAQAVGTILPQDGQRVSVQEKQKNFNGVSRGMSSPQPTSMHQAVVGASPIEIARAYMGTRTADADPAYKSMVLKDRTLQQSDEFASKPPVPSSSLLKSSPCWPGAVIQDKRDYVTPQSQKGSFGLCNFPRTPYSRAIYSKSKTKLLQSQSSGAPSNNLLSPLPALQSRTPTYGLKYSRRDSLNGSVGPIRRTRQKLALEASNGSDPFHSSQYGPLLIGSSSTSERMLPAAKKNLEIGAAANTSKYHSMDRKAHVSKPDVSTVRPQSSQLARSIYEHLDRSIVTPKGKSAELDIATTLKKTMSSEIMTAVSKEHVSLGQTGSCNSNKNMAVIDTSLSAQGNQDEQNPLRKAHHNERISKSLDAACSPAGAISSLEIGKTHGSSRFAGTNEATAAGRSGGRWKDNCHPGPLFNQSNGKLALKEDGNADAEDFINLQNKPPLNSSRVKRGLSSISIEKPGSRGTVSMETSAGFSFPVAASSCALSEPPTPSILPSFTTSDLHQPEGGSAVPSYGFGSKGSSLPVVFDFPFTSSATTRDNASDIKFNFGSDNKKARVCFSLVGKNVLS